MKLKNVRTIIRWIDSKNVGYYITKGFTGAETDKDLKEVQKKFLKQPGFSGVCRIMIRAFDETKAINIDPISEESLGKETIKALKAAVKELRKDVDKDVVAKMRIGFAVKAGKCSAFNIKSKSWG